MVELELPDLAKKMDEIGVPLSIVTAQWLTTVFVGHNPLTP